MRLRYLMAVAAMLLLASVAFAEGEAQELKKIGDGVYTYENVPSGSPHNRFGANAGIVVGDKAVLVVDTLTSAKEAQQLVKDIRKITDKPIKYVVNTHYHLDHALGNNVFADMGAVIIANEKCRDLLLASGEQTLKSGKMFGLPDDYWDGTRIAAPNITFVREYSVNLGNKVVKIIHPGVPSHSAGSAMVVVPDAGVIFTGDILFTEFHPYLGEGDFPGWAQTLDQIAAMDMKVIVPGHGPLSDKQDLMEMKEYLALFDAKAKELTATMNDPQQIAAEMLKVLPKRKDGAFIVGMNIGMRYMKKDGTY